MLNYQPINTEYITEVDMNESYKMNLGGNSYIICLENEYIKDNEVIEAFTNGNNSFWINHESEYTFAR